MRGESQRKFLHQRGEQVGRLVGVAPAAQNPGPTSWQVEQLSRIHFGHLINLLLAEPPRA
jgi:hypothetical protein